MNENINEIKELLTWFIKEQKVVNQEQKVFNKEQKIFNKEISDFVKEQREFNETIIKKIDKVQYFLEETIAENTKMFFEEQIEMKNYIRELENEVDYMKWQISDLSSRVNLLFKSIEAK